MLKFKRSLENPILRPDKHHTWESLGTFNGCPVKKDNSYYLLYRALSKKKKHAGVELELSTIGLAKSSDGIRFTDRKQILTPEEEWEQFGCEDPRVTCINGTYYIFYTALSTFPFTAAGIHIGLAITRDFKTFTKHSITPFNAKAMTLFPEKIQGKYTALLTANTDNPPARIAIAQADRIEDFWSYQYWDEWYMDIDTHTLPLLRSYLDHIEVGAPPLKTKEGWLFFYSYIRNYQTSLKVFAVEALLLDSDDPMKIKGSIQYPLLEPTEPYEKKGIVPQVTFPSGALLDKDTISLYYGAADTVCAVATCSVTELLEELKPKNNR
jgi:beta-1,2-mannobiose phosphorylase / 1,2-beta-oligomannan phosphorylase